MSTITSHGPDGSATGNPTKTKMTLDDFECIGLKNMHNSTEIHISTSGTLPDGTRKVLNDEQAKWVASECWKAISDLGNVTLPPSTNKWTLIGQGGSTSRFQSAAHPIVQEANRKAFEQVMGFDPEGIPELPGGYTIDSQLSGKTLRTYSVQGSHAFENIRAINAPAVGTRGSSVLGTELDTSHAESIKIPQDQWVFSQAGTGGLWISSIVTKCGGGESYLPARGREVVEEALSEWLSPESVVDLGTNSELKRAARGDESLRHVQCQIINVCEEALLGAELTCAELRAEDEINPAISRRTHSVDPDSIDTKPIWVHCTRLQSTEETKSDISHQGALM